MGELRRRGVGLVPRPATLVRVLTDLVSDVAPHIPIRDLATLQRHHPALSADALADKLIKTAAMTAAGVGAAGGGLAAVEWAVPPTLLTAPVLLGAETVAVVAIELKLIGELHAIYGVALPAGTMPRAVSLIQCWIQQRGINPLSPGVGTGAVLGAAARKQLRDQLLRRLGRNLTSLGPLLTGAAVAGYLNQRATQALGRQIRDDLRGRAPQISSARSPEQP